jgi:hypothetical protein
MMHAALEINLPNYASAIVTTKEIVEALSATYSARLAGADYGQQEREGTEFRASGSDAAQ